jgi:hypothetical protein
VTGRSRLAAAGAAAAGGLTLAVVTGAGAGAPPGRKDLFELSAALEGRVAAHQELVNNAGRSEDDFCKLTADTVQILEPVVEELSRFGGSEHQSVPFEAVERAYKRTQWLIPGLVLIVTEEVTQTGIDYRWLAKQAPAEARPLLRALADFEVGSEGVESWGVRITDYSICEAPERGRAALAALAKAWPAAPGCMREALRARLAAELERMATWNCFCGGREASLAAVRKNAELLKKLTDTRGPELAKRWLDGARAPDARFSCHPG